MVLDGVTSSLHLKAVTNTCKRMLNSPSISGSWGEAADFKYVVRRLLRISSRGQG